jgi:hypothetical protein
MSWTFGNAFVSYFIEWVEGDLLTDRSTKWATTLITLLHSLYTVFVPIVEFLGIINPLGTQILPNALLLV